MRIILGALALTLAACGATEDNVEARNKEAAKKFYEDLWFTDNTGTYADYVAESYVVHDLGDRKGVTEKAIAQKEIADLFHSFGNMTGEIDWQMADGDKVATRWFVSLDANEQAEAMGMTDVDRVAIINVFRFNEAGKIVEIWNHRHDPELPQPPADRPE